MIENTNGLAADMFSSMFIDLVDKAVSVDFSILPITDEDRKNDRYINTKSALMEGWAISVIYERKVLTSIKFLPRVQYLFGFKPQEGLCLLVNKKIHKQIVCGGKLAELNENCFLVNHLQFLLAQEDTYRYWAYVPPCPCKTPCSLTPKALALRTTLYIEEDPVEASPIGQSIV
jgi:hypothetical protein